MIWKFDDPMNQIRRGREMAEQVADVAQDADQVLLAQYSAEDFPNVIAAGFVTVSFEEYNQRIAGAVSLFEQDGATVVLVPVTAQELHETLARHLMPNAPNGRAAAIGLIHGGRLT